MLEDLFKFPVIMVDGRNEEEKNSQADILGIATDDNELDIVYGEAEYPYHDFIGVEDRWIPDKESFKLALKGKFNGCLVKFANVGLLLVPWNKEKFKEELAAFIKEREGVEEIPDEPKKVTVIKFTPDMLANLMKQVDDNEKNNG